MFAWPDGLPPFEDLKALFAGLAGVAAAAYMGWRGVTKGSPSPSTAALEAVAAKTCSAPALSLEIVALKKGQSEIQQQNRDQLRDYEQMQKDLDYVRDAVTRIEALQRARSGH